LRATLVFEQSYAGVEGDSASLAELCALISALAGVPLRQDLAMTGSVNQHGDVQAIGGINEKVEGFFDTCKLLDDLTGAQGVILPVANVQHLVLRQDVVEAVSSGDFHLYPVETVDEAIALLTGLPAGTPDAEGVYPPETVNGMVMAALAAMQERWQALRAHDGEEEQNDKSGDE
jgi:predicted ATP-dependent protease